MKVYRYMSNAEFAKMSAGCFITGKKNFKARTSSSGICFLPEITVAQCNGYEQAYDAMQAYAFLDGIVCGDVLVEFEADDDLFTKSVGVYANPVPADWDDEIMEVPELCISGYDRDAVAPLRYAIFNRDGFDWYNFN